MDCFNTFVAVSHTSAKRKWSSLIIKEENGLVLWYTIQNSEISRIKYNFLLIVKHSFYFFNLLIRSSLLVIGGADFFQQNYTSSRSYLKRSSSSRLLKKDVEGTISESLTWSFRISSSYLGTHTLSFLAYLGLRPFAVAPWIKVLGDR